MRIAIASSGLGHVARGIETWAMDTAAALAEMGVAGESVQCSVFSIQSAQGGNHGGKNGASGMEVTLFAGAPVGVMSQGAGAGIQRINVQVLSCFRRSGRLARVLARLAPGFTWRWGLKNPYGWEQWSFWRQLRRHLKRGGFDILHVQDPMLAYGCKRDRERGWLKTQEILAHGTEESAEFLSQFPCVQHLAPWHLEELQKKVGVGCSHRGAEDTEKGDV